MGLIDAEKIEINEECKFSGKGIKAFLNAISTAYDADNAVEELRDLLWDCYTDSGVGIDRETGFKAYEREMERIVRQNRR